MPLENSASSFIGGLYGSSRPNDRSRKAKLSVSEMLAMRDKGGPEMSPIFDPVAGEQLTLQQAAARGPYTTNVARTGGGGYGGHGGGYGGRGGMNRGQGHMSSSGLSSGVPTSARGRAALGMNPYLSASDTASMEFRSNFGKPLYGNMLPQPLPDPLTASTGQGLEKRTNPDGSVSWGNTTGFAKGSEDTGKRDRLAVVGEKGPEIVMMPAHSKVVPNHELPHYEKGTPMARNAFDDMMGTRAKSSVYDRYLKPTEEVVETAPVVEGFSDGEVRLDAYGNPWKYDTTQKRGIPENPYLNRSNAPTPRSAFTTSASARYDDLANRLAALRSEGLAAGRARVLGLQQQQAAEQAQRDAFLASGTQVSSGQGGGTSFRTPYGTAIVGGNRPKSFTVENFRGGQEKLPDLVEAGQESAADAARRRWAVADASVGTSPRAEAARRGGEVAAMRGYRAQPLPEPAAIDEVIGVPALDEAPPSAIIKAPQENSAIQSAPINELDFSDTPEAWSRMRRRNFAADVAPSSLVPKDDIDAKIEEMRQRLKVKQATSSEEKKKRAALQEAIKKEKLLEGIQKVLTPSLDWEAAINAF